MSGTFVSLGRFEAGLVGGGVVVEKGAVLRLPDPARPLELSIGELTGQGVIQGAVVNSGGTFEPYNAGSAIPLRIRGSYTQQPGAQLLLDLSAQSRPVKIAGFATIQGTVTYDNQPGYTPKAGQRRRFLAATRSQSWTPSCEKTTGSGSADGHWAASQFFTRVPAIFTAGAGTTC